MIETRIPNILTDWDEECSKGTRIADRGGFHEFSISIIVGYFGNLHSIKVFVLVGFYAE